MAAGTAKTLDPERRREYRVPVQLPMLVRGTDREGNWFQERTVLENLSCGGAAFTTLIALDKNSRIYVSIPASTSEEPDGEFSTKAQIVHVKPGKTLQEISIGVRFIGPRFQRTCVSLWT